MNPFSFDSVCPKCQSNYQPTIKYANGMILRTCKVCSHEWHEAALDTVTA